METARRTILMSGASRGIGRAIAEQALRDGHRLSLGLRNPDVLRGSVLDPAIAGSDRIQLVPYDAVDPEAASRWVEAADAAFAGFDALIHCAGILLPTPLLFSDAHAHEPELLLKVNLMGPWWLTRAAWPFLQAHGDARIQVLVSMSGKRSKGRLAGYASSKFALMGLCQTMRNEGWQSGIRVTAICPGWVNTQMVEGITDLPPEAMTQPQDLAALSSRLLELPASAVPFELAVSCLPEV
ncbi:MAG: short-chain dehydrogenase [Synechococcus sp. NAT40]|nr:short-chain dehydrogenase [Synechococcus sp. NAT40]